VKPQLANRQPNRPFPRPLSWLKVPQFRAFEAASTNAHRVASGADGWIERLGEDAMISYKNDAALADFSAGFEQWCADAGWRPSRLFGRFLPIKNDDRIAPVLISGDSSLPLQTVVSEAGVKFGIDFDAGYSHGLFLDQRSNRAHLRTLAPKRLLNTFSYTCSFSVVAALAGAETVSVDLSKKSLDRGRENFSLNELPVEGHRFFADDVLDFIPRLAKRGERFDAIVLDPPTFSRGNKGRRWQVEQHFEDLLNAALEVAAPRCAILLSTNCTKLDWPALERMARFAGKLNRRTVECVRSASLPDFPPGHGASTIWMNTR